jgi:hypothetical protein
MEESSREMLARLAGESFLKHRIAAELRHRRSRGLRQIAKAIPGLVRAAPRFALLERSPCRRVARVKDSVGSEGAEPVSNGRAEKERGGGPLASEEEAEDSERQKQDAAELREKVEAGAQVKKSDPEEERGAEA